MEIQKYKTILLDGDGVLWKSNQPMPGISDFFNILDQHEVRWALLTNNNSHTVNDYIDKLGQFGIRANSNCIFTSSTTTADYLLEKYGPDALLHVVGSHGLIETLKEAGLKFTIGEEQPGVHVDAVVAGMDRELNYKKITIAMRLIMDGANFIATNTDGSYPTPQGILPGTGMVIGALQFASVTEPLVMGKPQPTIYLNALKHLKCRPDEALMVGDRLDTDILGANQLGIHTAAVLSGVTSQNEINQKDIKPDYIFQDIAALADKLKGIYDS